jgi:sulfate adenylyltransferase subunit 1 (EFTu-like GTPase family)
MSSVFKGERYSRAIYSHVELAKRLEMGQESVPFQALEGDNIPWPNQIVQEALHACRFCVKCSD